MNPEDTTQKETPTEVQPLQPTSQHIENIIAKPQDDINTKKSRRTPKTNLFIAISLILILGVGIFIYMLMNKDAFPNIAKLLENATIQEQQVEEKPEPAVNNEEPKPVDNGPKPDENGNLEFISGNYEFAIKYPQKTTFIEPGAFNTPLETYQIIFSGKNQVEKITGPETLTDGYFVTITVHKDIINRNVDQIAIEKRNRYLIDCPDTATISEITGRTISGVSGRTFSVENCGVSYIQSFIVRDSTLFEFDQVYRGDLGFRQIYVNESNEIVNMFRLINTIEPTPVNTWVTYNGREYSFKHPTGLDGTCCTLKGTLGSKPAKKVVVLADPKSLKGTDNSQFNGFGVFEVDNSEHVSFDSYVNDQKSLLEENYRIVIGRNPNTSVNEITVGDQRIVILREYAWWGDVAITQLKSVDSDRFLVFIKTEVDEGSFEATFMEMLKTLTVTSNK